MFNPAILFISISEKALCRKVIHFSQFTTLDLQNKCFFIIDSLKRQLDCRNVQQRVVKYTHYQILKVLYVEIKLSDGTFYYQPKTRESNKDTSQINQESK